VRRIDKLLYFRFPPYTVKNLQAMQSQLAPKLPARPAGPPGAAASNRNVTRKWWFLAFALAAAGALTKLKSAGYIRGA
jgi:aldehyde dehydrogenase (NAD+)/aldehyde dehydrogenase (NAD(P)+)